MKTVLNYANAAPWGFTFKDNNGKVVSEWNIAKECASASYVKLLEL